LNHCRYELKISIDYKLIFLNNCTIAPVPLVFLEG